jgi:hypothetical protein
MKYYNEMMALETKLIEMETALAAFRGLINGAVQLDQECLQNALYFFDESLHNIHEASNSKFKELWRTIGSDVTPTLEPVLPGGGGGGGGLEKKRRVTDKNLD